MQIAEKFYGALSKIEKKANSILVKASEDIKKLKVKKDDIIHQAKNDVTSLEGKKISEINNCKKKHADYNDSVKLNLDEVDKVRRKIPTSLYYGNDKISVTSKKEPDYAEINQLITYLCDDTFWASIKRVFELFGYYSRKDMSRDVFKALKEAENHYQSLIRQNNDKEKKNISIIEDKYKKLIYNVNKKRDDDVKSVEGQISSVEQVCSKDCTAIVAECVGLKLEEKLSKGLNNSWYFKKNWTTFNPQGYIPTSIILGNIRVPAKLPPFISSELVKYIPKIFDGTNYILPYNLETSRAQRFFINYNDANKKHAIGAVQSMVMKVLKEAPLHSYDVSVIDPIDRGSNIGRLSILTKTEGCSLINKPVASENDIAVLLKKIEKQVDDMSLKLTGNTTIYDYNASHTAKMKYHIVIINDFEAIINNHSAMESLKVLANNSDKCGISLFIGSKETKLPLINEKFIQVITKGYDYYAITPNSTIPYESKLILDTVDKISDAYLQSMKVEYSKKVVKDNSFRRFYDLSKPISYKESTKGLSIPFAIDDNNEIKSLDLGTNLTAHAMLTGSIGCGKSTTLHALITGIALNYHPDDVQIWLIDYKRVEFAEYVRNQLPSIKLIGLENSKEFTYSVIDKITEIFEKRKIEFGNKGVQDITEYKKKYGVRSVSRIVLIIDEFHNFSQAIESDDNRRIAVENALSEYRALGLTCIFADQAVSAGLSGLTEKSKKQLVQRLAMRNTMDEVKDTLFLLPASEYTQELNDKIKTLSTGEVVYQEQLASSEGLPAIHADKYLSEKVTQNDRDNIAKYLQKQLSGYPINPDIIDSRVRSKFSPEDVAAFEKQYPLKDSTDIPFYCGSPSSLDKCFRFSLAKTRGENALICVGDDNMRMSIVYYSLRSFIKRDNTRVLIIADPNDTMYNKYSKQWDVIKGDKKIKCVTELEELCKIANKMSKDMSSKGMDTLILAVGLDSFFEDMERLPSKEELERSLNAPSFSTATTATDIDFNSPDFEALMRAMDEGTDVEITESEPVANAATNVPSAQTVKYLYDAREDIAEIIAFGPKKGIHTILALDSYKQFKMLRPINLDEFYHKIGSKMSDDDSYDLMGSSVCSTSLDDITLNYNSGSRSSNKTFRPYII